MHDKDPTSRRSNPLLARDVSEIVQRLPKYAKLSWLLIRDSSLSTRQRAALMGALGYSVSPIDAIPGIIPVIGQMDDLAVVLLALRYILRSLPPGRSSALLEQCGLGPDTLDADLETVKLHGLRILKRIRLNLSLGAAFTLGVGRYAGREIRDSLKAGRESEGS